MKLLQALIPDVNVEETLAQLVTPNQTTPHPQTTTIPTPQPFPEPTPPKPDTTEKPQEIVESEPKVEKIEEEGRLQVETEIEPEGDGEGEKVVEGEDITEGEVVVSEEELREEREREMKTKVEEDATFVDEIVGEVSGKEEAKDGKSESRETTEVLESEREGEEGSVGVSEEQGGSDGAVDESEGGSEIFRAESETEVVSEGDQNRNTEEGEVVNQDEKKRKECKAVMRKSQVPYYRKIKELSRGCTPTRRSNRIAGKLGQAGSSQHEWRQENIPLEISSDDQEEEEETPFVRKPRSTPADQVTPAKERETLTVKKMEELKAPRQEKELGEKEQSEAEAPGPTEEPAGNAAEEPVVDEEEVETRQPGQEEDEDDEPPLKNRLRTSGSTHQGEDTAEEPREAHASAQTTANTLPTSVGTAKAPREEEREEVDEDTYQRERKRKGKMPAKSTKKKARKVNTTVVIQEPIQVPFGQKDNEEGESTEPEESSSGELYTMSEEIPNPNDNVSLVDEFESPERITYEKILVELDDELLAEMKRFKDPNLQATFNQMDSKSKGPKSGKMIHLPSVIEVSAKTTLFAYIEQIGFEWMLNIDTTEAPVNLAREYFTSFRFRITADLDNHL